MEVLEAILYKYAAKINLATGQLPAVGKIQVPSGGTMPLPGAMPKIDTSKILRPGSVGKFYMEVTPRTTRVNRVGGSRAMVTNPALYNPMIGALF